MTFLRQLVTRALVLTKCSVHYSTVTPTLPIRDIISQKTVRHVRNENTRLRNGKHTHTPSEELVSKLASTNHQVPLRGTLLNENNLS